MTIIQKKKKIQKILGFFWVLLFVVTPRGVNSFVAPALIKFYENLLNYKITPKKKKPSLIQRINFYTTKHTQTKTHIRVIKIVFQRKHKSL